MRDKLLLMTVLALAVSGCGMVKFEREVLDPTDAVDQQIDPAAVIPSPRHQMRATMSRQSLS